MATHGYGYSTVPPPPPPPLTDLILPPLLAVASFPAAFLLQLTGVAASAASIPGELLSPNSPAESRSGRLAAKITVAASLIASPLHDWSFLAVVVLCGRDLVDAGVSAAVDAVEPRFGRSKGWTYYSSGGLTRPLCSVLHFALILLTWRFSNLATAHHPITCYGAWLFGALFVRSALILANAVIMAWWMEKEIYERYETRILLAGFHIHILSGFLLNGDSGLSSILVPWRKQEAEAAGKFYRAEDYIHYFSRHRVTTQEGAAMARCVQEVTARLPPQLAAGIFGDIIVKTTGIDPHDFKNIRFINKRWIKERLRLSEEDARVVYGELCALVGSRDYVSFHTFFTWAEGAYRESQAVGYTLRQEEQAIVDCDQRLMTLLINEAFLLWLFFAAGNATAQVLAAIPLLCFGVLFVDELVAFDF